MLKQKSTIPLKKKGIAHIILATGSSQLKFLAELRKKMIPWKKVVVFHLDEYMGLAEDHPAGFRHYLRKNIIDHVQPRKFYPIDATNIITEEILTSYSVLLRAHPIDLACVGIGENGHLAFNDPGVADFNDPLLIKPVTLDLQCREQQWKEGWFETLDLVPKKALTLTIPAIMNANHISCFVPDKRKAQAVKNAIEGEITENCPASVLRNHPSVDLYLDPPAASLLSF
jgi:glucosamine-6-phosphate deaminase